MDRSASLIRVKMIEAKTIEDVETQVNAWLRQALKCIVHEIVLDSCALTTGMAGERWSDVVRTVCIVYSPSPAMIQAEGEVRIEEVNRQGGD